MRVPPSPAFPLPWTPRLTPLLNALDVMYTGAIIACASVASSAAVLVSTFSAAPRSVR